MECALGSRLSHGLAVCSSLVASCGGSEPVAEPSADKAASAGAAWFTDVTDAVGLGALPDRATSGAHFMPDSMSAGCALFDCDGDGDLDVYLVNGFAGADGKPDPERGRNRLYRQEADGRFVDATAASGLGDPGYGMGVALGDFDDDGDLDVYVTNLGPDALYRNEGGGRFVDVTAAAGLGRADWGSSALFFDADLDGDLDLFVANYLAFDPIVPGRDDVGRPEYPGPHQFAGVPDALYLNDGGGRFVDGSAAAGIAARPGKGLGVVHTDLNGDHLPDVYVANDREPNFAWINLGDGRFENRATETGLACNEYGAPEASMGITIGDYDGDLDLDLLVTHFVQESHTLYANRGPGQYEDATRRSGLGAATRNATGFGAAFLDMDHDADLDLVVANGRVLRMMEHPGARLGAHWKPYAEPNQVFRNDGQGRFEDVSSSCGGLGAEVEVSRGLAVGDVDGDGDVDVLITNGNGSVRLYRNDVPKSGRWLVARAWDPERKRDALGAELRLSAGGRELVREIRHTDGYLSSADAAAHFGLGAVDEVESIHVRWPDGREELFGPFLPDRRVTLVAGEGRALR